MELRARQTTRGNRTRSELRATSIPRYAWILTRVLRMTLVEASRMLDRSPGHLARAAKRYDAEMIQLKTSCTRLEEHDRAIDATDEM